VTDSVLAQAFVYLAAAVIGVPIAKRLGLGSVLGYLLAGVIIGPHVIGLVGGEGHKVMHFAEFGVVMMLFLVGLELEPKVLWALRRPILGMGGLQVAITAAAVAGIALAFGVAAKPAVATGMILAMSSTAIVLSTLAEKQMLKTAGGQASFSVLLFQDIAVIPILAIFPVLAAAPVVSASSDRPGWLQGLIVLGTVVGIVASGRLVIKPMFRVLAMTRLRETFTAAALLLVVGIALLMTVVGLSPALGTFLAGVVLAESEYRHELEGDIEPFKGLLLGLFFISVGAQIDFDLIADDPLRLSGLTVGVMAIKLGVLYGLARLFDLDRSARWLFAFGLCQVGEFAFVLLGVAVQSQIFGPEHAAPLVAVVAMSMAMTPFLFILLERVILPRLTAGKPQREHDKIEHADTPVVIAGYGRFGQIVGRMLRANGVGMTILDLDPDMVDVLGRLGIKVYYGDATRLELLHAAGCEKAKLFVVAIDDMAAAVTVTKTVRHNFPHLRIIARVRNRQSYYDLSRAGADVVVRETFGSAFEVGIEALKSMGFRAYTAQRLANRWRKHEERELGELGKLWDDDDEAPYWAAARRSLAEAERLMHEDPRVHELRDGAWDNESLRAEQVTRPTPAASASPADESS
jgi:monovalent cation:proton antiporter-2 (CPA2) family protein